MLHGTLDNYFKFIHESITNRSSIYGATNYTYLVFEAVEIGGIVNVNNDETLLSRLFYYLSDSLT